MTMKLPQACLLYTSKELIHYLVKTAGYNANLLLNVGPRPNGEFPEIAVERYKAMGKWLEQYGETIYGTRGGIVTPRHWGVTTQKAVSYTHLDVYKRQEGAPKTSAHRSDSNLYLLTSFKYKTA